MPKILKAPSANQDATTVEWVKTNSTNGWIGAYSTEPNAAFGGDGDLFIPTDSIYLEAILSGAWVQLGPTRLLVEPPALGGFTADNIGDSTTDTTRGGIRLLSGTPTNQIRAYYKTCPSAPWTLEAAFLSGGAINTSGDSGIFMRDGSGKIMTCSYSQNGSFRVDKWTSSSSFSTNAKTDSMGLGIPFTPHWVRIRDNNTDIFFDFSYDLGTTWLNRYKEARGSFFSSGPTQVGFFVNDANLSGGASVGAQTIWLYHWKEINS